MFLDTIVELKMCIFEKHLFLHEIYNFFCSFKTILQLWISQFAIYKIKNNWINFKDSPRKEKITSVNNICYMIINWNFAQTINKPAPTYKNQPGSAYKNPQYP